MNVLKKILKWLGISVGVLVLLFAGTYLYLSIDAPPAYVTPGKDLLATGTPSLPFPDGKAETFEPHIAIDPNNPDHLVTAAMMGDRFGRGGRNLYRWTSRDGGKSWQGAKVKALAFQDNFAADSVIAFDEMGRDHLIAMFGNRPFPKDPVILYMILKAVGLGSDESGDGRPLSEEEEEPRGGGIAMSIGDPATGKLGAPARISPIPSNGSDKTWLTIDNGKASPHCGNVYATWTETDTWSIVMSIGRAGGKVDTIGKLIVPAENNAYWPSISVRLNGRLDVIWFHQKK